MLFHFRTRDSTPWCWNERDKGDNLWTLHTRILFVFPLRKFEIQMRCWFVIYWQRIDIIEIEFDGLTSYTYWIIVKVRHLGLCWPFFLKGSFDRSNFDLDSRLYIMLVSEWIKGLSIRMAFISNVYCWSTSFLLVFFVESIAGRQHQINGVNGYFCDFFLHILDGRCLAMTHDN